MPDLRRIVTALLIRSRYASVRVSTSVLLMTAAMVAGCTVGGRSTVDVGTLSFVEASEEAARFDLVVEVENRSQESMTLREFTYTFENAAGGRYVGRRAAQATLQSGRRQQFVLPVVLPADRAVSEGDSWTMRGRLTYLTPGEVARVFFEAGLRRPRVTFSGSHTGRALSEPGSEPGGASASP